MRSRYQHSPLTVNGSQIRLIKLHAPAPGVQSEDQTPVCCDIGVFDLASCPPYSTLSYIWGAPAPIRTIISNGQDLDIRDILHVFLQSFRNDPSNDCYIWIDQICIDQGNVLERNHQVKLMSSIYKKCTRVIVWLNSDHEGYISTERPLTTEPAIRSLTRLLSNQYFSRLWIVQEIILPPAVAVFYSDSTWIEWDELSDEALATPARSSPILWMFRRRKEAYQYGINKTSLRNAVKRFGPLQCENPRDKIYGLLSLVLEDERPAINYEGTLEDVFCDVVKSLDIILQTRMVGKESFCRRAENYREEHTETCSAVAEALGMNRTIEKLIHMREICIRNGQQRGVKKPQPLILTLHQTLRWQEEWLQKTLTGCRVNRTYGTRRLFFDYRDQRYYGEDDEEYPWHLDTDWSD